MHFSGGDDDQNIYAWRDTNNRYIERFREDYSAATSYLVENYRSTQRIIAAANQLVDNNPGRLKASYPIRINRERQSDPLGGQWQTLDSDRSGRVARLAIESSDRVVGNLQAQAAIAELKRLLALEVGDWNGCSILARTHHYLWPVQALCELGEFRTSWPRIKTVRCPSLGNVISWLLLISFAKSTRRFLLLWRGSKCLRG